MGIAPQSVRWLALIGVLPLFYGCHSMGPSTVARDRFDYSEAISDSWKRQTLLNIVKLRYDDPPIFVDVGQIVAGYTLETGGTVGGQVQSVSGSNGVALGGAITYTDRPTITYVPLTGSSFMHAIITPIPPEALFSAIQAGWPADLIMLAGVSSINGLKNQQRKGGSMEMADNQFLRAIELMREIQLSDAVSVRVVTDAQKKESTLISIRSQNLSPEIQQDIAELHKLLKLSPDAQEFQLVFGGMPANDHEVAVVTRSMIHIMSNMASQVDVPPEDTAAGRVNPGWGEGGAGSNRPRLIHIYSSEIEPKDAYVDVYYHKHWFWISDEDLKSKHVFSLIMLLFTLGDNSEAQGAPVLTIPT